MIRRFGVGIVRCYDMDESLAFPLLWCIDGLEFSILWLLRFNNVKNVCVLKLFTIFEE